MNYNEQMQKNIILGQSLNLVAEMMVATDKDKDYEMMKKLLFQRAPEMFRKMLELRESLGLADFTPAPPTAQPSPKLFIVAKSDGSGMQLNEEPNKSNLKID